MSGFRNDFDAIIVKSRFGFEKLNVTNEHPSLILSLEDNHNGKFDVAFSTGGGWQIVDNGRRVEHPFRHNFVVGSAAESQGEKLGKFVHLLPTKFLGGYEF